MHWEGRPGAERRLHSKRAKKQGRGHGGGTRPVLLAGQHPPARRTRCWPPRRPRRSRGRCSSPSLCEENEEGRAGGAQQEGRCLTAVASSCPAPSPLNACGPLAPVSHRRRQSSSLSAARKRSGSSLYRLPAAMNLTMYSSVAMAAERTAGGRQQKEEGRARVRLRRRRRHVVAQASAATGGGGDGCSEAGAQRSWGARSEAQHTCAAAP